jgi:hypothetical protein
MGRVKSKMSAANKHETITIKALVSIELMGASQPLNLVTGQIWK